MVEATTLLEKPRLARHQLAADVLSAEPRAQSAGMIQAARNEKRPGDCSPGLGHMGRGADMRDRTTTMFQLSVAERNSRRQAPIAKLRSQVE